MGMLSNCLKHPDEVVPLVSMYRAARRARAYGGSSDDLAFCFDMLNRVSRSFAMVTCQLPPGLRDAVCVYYLILRALDTVEDDMRIPADRKVSLLLSFHEDAARSKDDPGAVEVCGDGDYRDLMEGFPAVSRALAALRPGFSVVLLETTRDMGAGMAEFVRLGEVKTVKQYDRYCYYVAGLVGIGLSRLFAASGREATSIEKEHDLAVHMALLLQKTNIIRDFLEDMEEEPRPRIWWPRELWEPAATYDERKGGKLIEIVDRGAGRVEIDSEEEKKAGKKETKGKRAEKTGAAKAAEDAADAARDAAGAANDAADAADDAADAADDAAGAADDAADAAEDAADAADDAADAARDAADAAEDDSNAAASGASVAAASSPGPSPSLPLLSSPSLESFVRPPPGSVEESAARRSLNAMVADALRHAVPALEYMSKLHDPDVFRFCAIPQAMALGTLARCLDNAAVFRGVVKMRRGETAKVFFHLETQANIATIFRVEADDMLRAFVRRPGLAADPSAKLLAARLSRVRDVCYRRFEQLGKAKFQREREERTRQLGPAGRVVPLVIALVYLYLANNTELVRGALGIVENEKSASLDSFNRAAAAVFVGYAIVVAYLGRRP